MFVKICGITNLDDAMAAEEAGANALGFNFWKPGKRYIEPERAVEIAAAVNVKKVAVFVDEEIATVLKIAKEGAFDVIQLHGAETAEHVRQLAPFEVWKAVKMQGAIPWDSWGVKTFLLDSPGTQPGGTGVIFDWNLAAAAKKHGQVILAGGLHAGNVADAIRHVHPWGVDVASGVESKPGRKSQRLMQAFVRAARSVEEAK